jgi:hypothetical protein
MKIFKTPIISSTFQGLFTSLRTMVFLVQSNKILSVKNEDFSFLYMKILFLFYKIPLWQFANML